MKGTILGSLVFLASVMANAAVQSGNIYYVHVDASKYQLGSGKVATATMDVGFLSQQDAELAGRDATKMKNLIETAMAESKADATSKKGKMILGAEVASKLQESGIKAQTVLWNSFQF